ncbi:MAG: hypothetical protein ACR2F6_15345 [Mycobacteriales bacterium]
MTTDVAAAQPDPTTYVDPAGTGGTGAVTSTAPAANLPAANAPAANAPAANAPAANAPAANAPANAPAGNAPAANAPAANASAGNARGAGRRPAPRRPPPPPPPTPVQLARQVLPQLTPPAPTPYKSPQWTHQGQPITIVNAHTWYWIDPALWKPLSRTLTVRGSTATVTLTPSRLRVTPGDGAATVDCGSTPGTVRTPSYGPRDIPSPSGCEHQYRTVEPDGTHATVTATYQLGWTAAFAGRTATGATVNGTLGTATSQATMTFGVYQVHAVLVD